MVPVAAFTSLLMPLDAGVCASSGEQCRCWARSRDLFLSLSRDLSLARSRDRSLARFRDLSFDRACRCFSRMTSESFLVRLVGLGGLMSRLFSRLSIICSGLYNVFIWF